MIEGKFFELFPYFPISSYRRNGMKKPYTIYLHLFAARCKFTTGDAFDVGAVKTLDVEKLFSLNGYRNSREAATRLCTRSAVNSLEEFLDRAARVSSLCRSWMSITSKLLNG